MNRFQLENNVNTSHPKKQKYSCPQCQKYGVFTRYIDLQNKSYIHHAVGICDRIDNCGYHYPPKQYFKDNNIPNEGHRSQFIPSLPKPRPATYIDPTILEASLKHYDSNNFVLFLRSIFDKSTVDHLINSYKIGTSNMWGGGSTVFWQIDAQRKVRSGKIIKYQPNGKRTKKISWVHSRLRFNDFNLQQCLFGEHLINAHDKPIAIVESEKTAIISSVYFPNYIWLASGSLNNLSLDKFKNLQQRKVVLYPDTSTYGTAYNLWSARAKELSDQGINCVVNSTLEKNASLNEKKSGSDLADYLLKYPIDEFRASRQKKIITEQDRVLESIIQDNPSIKKLIEKFDLSILY